MTSLFATLALHWAARDDWFVEQLNADVAPHQVQKLYYLTTAFDFPGPTSTVSGAHHCTVGHSGLR